MIRIEYRDSDGRNTVDSEMPIDIALGLWEVAGPDATFPFNNSVLSITNLETGEEF